MSLIPSVLLSQVSLHQSPALTGLSHAPHGLTPDQLSTDNITCRLQLSLHLTITIVLTPTLNPNSIAFGLPTVCVAGLSECLALGYLYSRNYCA